MIGTRLDETDEPRLIRSRFGWWFIGNNTLTLLAEDAIGPDRTVDGAIQAFLEREGAFRPRLPSSFLLTVLPTTACNLGCGYCFQNVGLDPTGGFRPPRIGRSILDETKIDAIVRFTEKRMEAAGLEALYLLLFGGEPLLNPRACLALLERCAAIGLRTATMTTNGVLLTRSLAKSLEEAGLVGAQITFDGNRTDHDRIRVKHSGGGTFDAIVDNLGAATDATGLQWNLRVNVSHHNFEGIGELFPQLAYRVDPVRCNITLAWVGDAGFGYENRLTRFDSVADAFVDWSVAAIEAGFHVSRPSMRTTCQICSAPGGLNGAVVTADGSLYSCWQSAGKRGFEVGSIADGYFDVQSVPGRWVTCGYEYGQADAAVVEEFQDRVDGRVLDYIYTSGRL